MSKIAWVVGLLAVIALVAVGCGVGSTATPGEQLLNQQSASHMLAPPTTPLPTPTPTPIGGIVPIVFQCDVTDAGYEEPWKVVRGEDEIPSGPDPRNRMGCRFDQAVESVTVILTNDDDQYPSSLPLDAPATLVRFPLEGIGTVPNGVPVGTYHRWVLVTYEDGGRAQVPVRVDTVYVVEDRDDEVPYTPTPPTATATPTPIGNPGGPATPTPAYFGSLETAAGMAGRSTEWRQGE